MDGWVGDWVAAAGYTFINRLPREIELDAAASGAGGRRWWGPEEEIKSESGRWAVQSKCMVKALLRRDILTL